MGSCPWSRAVTAERVHGLLLRAAGDSAPSGRGRRRDRRRPCIRHHHGRVDVRRPRLLDLGSRRVAGRRSLGRRDRHASHDHRHRLADAASGVGLPAPGPPARSHCVGRHRRRDRHGRSPLTCARFRDGSARRSARDRHARCGAHRSGGDPGDPPGGRPQPASRTRSVGGRGRRGACQCHPSDRGWGVGGDLVPRRPAPGVGGRRPHRGLRDGRVGGGCIARRSRVRLAPARAPYLERAPTRRPARPRASTS